MLSIPKSQLPYRVGLYKRPNSVRDLCEAVQSMAQRWDFLELCQYRRGRLSTPTVLRLTRGGVGTDGVEAKIDLSGSQSQEPARVSVKWGDFAALIDHGFKSGYNDLEMMFEHAYREGMDKVYHPFLEVHVGDHIDIRTNNEPIFSRFSRFRNAGLVSKDGKKTHPVEEFIPYGALAAVFGITSYLIFSLARNDGNSRNKTHLVARREASSDSLERFSSLVSFEVNLAVRALWDGVVGIVKGPSNLVNRFREGYNELFSH